MYGFAQGSVLHNILFLFYYVNEILILIRRINKGWAS